MKPRTLPPLRSARLLDQMRERIRYCHYSLRTEQAYLFWVRKDRVVMLPEPLIIPLRRQLERSHALWAENRAHRVPGVSMPDALARKYPRAAERWASHVEAFVCDPPTRFGR